MKTIAFFVYSLFCKHRTIVHSGDLHSCLFCKVEVPEDFEPPVTIVIQEAAHA